MVKIKIFKVFWSTVCVAKCSEVKISLGCPTLALACEKIKRFCQNFQKKRENFSTTFDKQKLLRVKEKLEHGSQKVT